MDFEAKIQDLFQIRYEIWISYLYDCENDYDYDYEWFVQAPDMGQRYKLWSNKLI